jgi:hypothetical protein
MQKLNTEALGARFYLNGFPKSGLHLLGQTISPIATMMPPDWLEAPWIGMFQGKSFTEERAPIDQITFGLARTKEGHYLKGHCGFDPDLERYMFYSGIIHLFIYRDFRDVAVSQAYHILSSDNVTRFHPDKHMYKDLGGFDEVLSAVITGLGDYTGVMSRWEHYAPWLGVDWTLSLKFAALRREPMIVSEFIIQHMIDRLSKIMRMGTKVDHDILRKVVISMSEAGKERKKSPTFRKGRVGDWKKVFTPKHVEEFKESDKNNWLLKLGFETKEDWHGRIS